jgi:D-arabinose 1-dehydrogenase-like Zn-dependent alcohol dehydrogenase
LSYETINPYSGKRIIQFAEHTDAKVETAFVANCIRIRGSFVGTRKDMAKALAFAAAGKVKADIELQPLSSISQIFERLKYGDVASRMVLDFARD